MDSLAGLVNTELDAMHRGKLRHTFVAGGSILFAVAAAWFASGTIRQSLRAEEKSEADDGAGPISTNATDASVRRKKPLRVPPVDTASPPVRIRVNAEQPISPPRGPETPPEPVDYESASDTDAGMDSVEPDPIVEKAPDHRRPAEDPSAARQSEIEPIVLKGIQPGTSTLSDVQRGWGQPKSATSQDGMAQQVFDLEPFQQATVHFNGRVVSTILLELREPIPAESVAEEMELSEFVAVPVADGVGRVLGWAFPERGVLFRFSDEQPGHVARLILEPITPEPFALRAEQRLETECTAGLADCAQALRLDPQHAQAHWLESRLLLATGQANDALAAAQEAAQLDDTNFEYRLTLIRALDDAGAYASALAESRQLAERTDLESLPAARAQALWGDLLAGQQRDYRQASERHTQAIKLAQPLLRSKNPVTASAARQLLIEANLAMAYDVAWGNWKGKQKVVGKWLDKAAALAAEAPESAGNAVQFQIASQALAAMVGLQGESDPREWSSATLVSGRALVAAAVDAGRRRQLEWKLGTALYDALQAYQLAGEQGQAIKFGQLALDHLNTSIADQEPTAAQSYLLGRLNFRIGVIYAVHNKDHQQAVAWFERALPHIEPGIKSPAGDSGRTGETLVSMAVSYWAVGDRETALGLSNQGLKMIQQAVRGGQLPRDALNVPTANWAFMQRALNAGEEESTARREFNSLQR